MNKRKKDLLFDHTGAVCIEDMIEDRGPSNVPYAPPPNEDAKWKALVAVGVMPNWNGTMKGVMVCLIQCANYLNGKCCPSETWIAGRLKCTDRAVRKAVAKIEKAYPKFLQVYHRSVSSASGEWQTNGYIIGWQALNNVCHITFPWTDRRNERSGGEERTFREMRNERSRKGIEGEDIEGRNRPKRVHPPLAADTDVDDSHLKKKEAFSGEPVLDSSTIPQSPHPLEGPSEADAVTAVSGYCTAFDWDRLTDEAYETAIAAEMETPGSGLAVVKAASQEAWRLKQKGASNAQTTTG